MSDTWITIGSNQSNVLKPVSALWNWDFQSEERSAFKADEFLRFLFCNRQSRRISVSWKMGPACDSLPHPARYPRIVSVSWVNSAGRKRNKIISYILVSLLFRERLTNLGEEVRDSAVGLSRNKILELG
jgi:hypothetical protein